MERSELVGHLNTLGEQVVQLIHDQDGFADRLDATLLALHALVVELSQLPSP